MSGRHRKPSSTRRIARAGVLGVLAGAPLLLSGTVLSGTALAAPGGGLSPERRSGGDEHSRDHDDEDSDEYADYDDSGDDSGDDGSGDSGDEGSGDEGYGEGYAGDDDEERSGHADYDEADFRHADYSDRDRSDRSERSRGDNDEEPAERSVSTSSGGSYSQARWDRLARCESSQNWNADTGNGYRGGLQFSDSTWRGYGGHRYAPSADQASREEQIAVAEKVQREQGWNAWPSCSRQLGYT